MGNRHQSYLIARVGATSRRRCVAGIHYQHSDGVEPVRAIRRLMTLVAQKENAAVVRGELRALDGVSDDENLRTRFGHPCPFSASLLLAAFTTDLEEGGAWGGPHTQRSELLPVDMDYRRIWNDCGITVVDITHPEQPAYICVNGDSLEDAETYVIGDVVIEGGDSAGEEEHGDETQRHDRKVWCEFQARVVKTLHDVPLIPLPHLEEVWPSMSSYRTHCQPAAPGSGLQVQAHSPMPTLAETSLEVALTHVAKTGDMTMLEAIPRHLMDAAQVQSVLRNLAPFPDHGLHLLRQTFLEQGATTQLDLSEFPELTGKQICSLIASIGSIEWLNVSFNKAITAEDVGDIASTTTSLRRLVVMCCPSVSDAALVRITSNEPQRFKSIEGILHPVFFLPGTSGPLHLQPSEPLPVPHSAFTFTYIWDRRRDGWWWQRGYGSYTPLPFFTPAQVVQNFTDVVPWALVYSRDAFYPEDVFEAVVCAAFVAGKRRPGQRWCERSMVSARFAAEDRHRETKWGIPTRGEREKWVLYVCWNYYGEIRMHPEWKGWGFIHYKIEVPDADACSIPRDDPSSLQDSDDSLGNTQAGPGSASESESATPPPRPLHQRGRRPLPTPDEVCKLQALLDMVDPKTGELYCPLVKPEMVPPLRFIAP
ncbi:hypothetical protein FKP32DRAFT_1762048 [Trametes sanguinea]|nr:hypothetical protein FKP32DRAFT_1762048 [Trametes sanguinea]